MSCAKYVDRQDTGVEAGTSTIDGPRHCDMPDTYVDSAALRPIYNILDSLCSTYSRLLPSESYV